MHSHAPPWPKARHVQSVVPYVHSRPLVVHMVIVPVGCIAGHMPHVHVPPPPPTPAAAQLQLFVPPSAAYVQGPSPAHAATGGVHIPVGSVPGQAVQVVQVQTGIAVPPPQSHTTSP
jgi:hypothetical protein